MTAGPQAAAHVVYLISERQNMAVAIVQKTRDYVTEVVDEMKKVTWPDWAQLKSATWVIILFVLIVAAIIFAMDSVVRAAIALIMNLFAR